MPWSGEIEGVPAGIDAQHFAWALIVEDFDKGFQVFSAGLAGCHA
ncbi:MAG TPA: hypothetical protein VEI95_19020 [Acidobacteriota bacterium]|nr:hypothetical protein [Acidobacteriota bacterium]